MRPKERFEKAFKKTVIPTLRALGFTGSLPTFRRDEGKDAAVIVNVQGSGGGDGCYVNLGVHHKKLKARFTNWDKLREYECAFRARLNNVAGDSFFAYGDSDDEAALLADGLSEMLKTEGALWFEQLLPSSLPETLKSLAKDGLSSSIPYGPPATAETFAKLSKALGDKKSEQAFLKEATRNSALRQKEREQESRSTTTVKMTWSEYKAASRSGSLPEDATIQILESAPKEKNPTTKSNVKAKTKSKAKPKAKKSKAKMKSKSKTE